MDNDKFFEELENLIKDLDGKKLPDTLKLTIFYTTGEKDVFNVTIAFWAKMMIATKNRKQYLYCKHNLINLNHVVKMQYEEID
ncbi:hypothetical protein [Lederbergia lenta]|uniref:hypothetical protein n=1 Tax=Lederbergia lenta TaxID=1467 RepID=UPI00203C515E|nr:hypothetical protein [Lederbergia lenta]MCM3111665.1 hypothetical protein [Lederbergia lenta]